MKIDFHEGDSVTQGQVLAEIDPRPFQVQLELAQATLAHDQALLNNARLDVARYTQLLATEAIPKQQLDTQVALVAQDEATVQQDAANIDNARLQLTYAKVTAPISGVVGLRLVDPGNIVHASDATGMVVITQLQPIAVLFTIPEDSLPPVTQKLRAGAHLTVEVYNRDNSKKLATGTLVTVDNQIDNTTGTSKLKAVFDNRTTRSSRSSSSTSTCSSIRSPINSSSPTSPCRTASRAPSCTSSIRSRKSTSAPYRSG